MSVVNTNSAIVEDLATSAAIHTGGRFNGRQKLDLSRCGTLPLQDVSEWLNVRVLPLLQCLQCLLILAAEIKEDGKAQLHIPAEYLSCSARQ